MRHKGREGWLSVCQFEDGEVLWEGFKALGDTIMARSVGANLSAELGGNSSIHAMDVGKEEW